MMTDSISRLGIVFMTVRVVLIGFSPISWERTQNCREPRKGTFSRYGEMQKIALPVFAESATFLSPPKPAWRNWQTRTTQNRVPFRSVGSIPSAGR